MFKYKEPKIVIDEAACNDAQAIKSSMSPAGTDKSPSVSATFELKQTDERPLVQL